MQTTSFWMALPSIEKSALLLVSLSPPRNRDLGTQVYSLESNDLDTKLSPDEDFRSNRKAWALCFTGLPFVLFVHLALTLRRFSPPAPPRRTPDFRPKVISVCDSRISGNP